MARFLVSVSCSVWRVNRLPDVLQSGSVLFSGWSEPDCNGGCENGLNDGSVELDLHRLWEGKSLSSQWYPVRSWEIVVPRDLKDINSGDSWALYGLGWDSGQIPPEAHHRLNRFLAVELQVAVRATDDASCSVSSLYADSDCCSERVQSGLCHLQN